MAAWVGPVVGGAIGAAGSLMGQSSANAMNMSLNQQNMDWQTMMSDTAMQRRVTDLKAAGLNPLLAVGQGGATTPGFSPIAMQNAFGPGAAQSVSGVASEVADVSLKRAQVDATNAQAQRDVAEAKRIAGVTLTGDVSQRAAEAGIAGTQAGAAASTASAAASMANADQLRHQLDVQNAQIGLLNAQRGQAESSKEKIDIDAETAGILQDGAKKLQALEIRAAQLGLVQKQTEASGSSIVADGLNAIKAGTNAFGNWLGGHAADFRDALVDWGNELDAKINRGRR